MLTGIGTLAGSIAIVVAAILGRKAVTDFRHQKHAEKEMEYAERILTAAYRLKDVIAAIRNPMSTAQELGESEAELKATGALDEVLEAKKKNLIQANVFFIRAKQHASLFEEAYSLLPIAKAFFGEEVSSALFEFIRARHSVLVYARAYANDSGHDPKFTQKIHDTIWGGGDDDEFAKKLDESIQLLEAELLRIIRPESDRKK